MNTSFPYPSFDGSSSWNMVAPQAQYYGAQNDHLYYQQQAHQAALVQAQQQQVAAAAFAYAPSAYAHPAAPQYYAQPQAQYVAPQAVAEPTRSRFAFAHAAPAHFEQRGFNLPPPAHHAYGHDEYMAEVQAYGHAESASRATLENEYDHPSHNRPPHHRNDVTALQMMQQTDEPITYDLIPNVSSVPPPPPIERSAVPLADVATEMVWEVCRQGYLQAAERSSVATAASPAGVIGQPARGPRRSGGGEQFGVIGGGRARKASQDGYDSSSSSSPSSSMPGTPSGFETVEDAAARRQRLASLGLGSFGGDMRSSSHSRTRAAPSPFPVEPSSAFRQFVKQILTATLVAPEDIVLALYYVSQVPLDKIIPPTPAEPGQDAQTTSFKAAPFKMVLGALMLANKTLQDNSYRNDTFSTVSGIPLQDVNALEAHILLALGFDVAIREDKWVSWLAIVVDRVRSGRGDLGDLYGVQDALERLIRAAARNTASLPLPSSPRLVATPVLAVAPAFGAECPSTPAHPSAASYLDLDASGPLESPLRRGGPAVAAVAGPAVSRPTRFGVPSASVPTKAQDSPLVSRSRAPCRAGNEALLRPYDFSALRSRSFGQEVNRAIY